MKSTLQQINPDLQSSLQLRQGAACDLNINIASGAGFLCSVSTQGDALQAQITPVAHDAPVAAASELADRVVGGSSSVVLRLLALEQGKANVILRHSRPWLGEIDPMAEEFVMEVEVVPSEDAQNAWEDQVEAPPVSDKEVRAVLDILDGRKPYGSRKCDAIRQALAIVAKDLAVHQHAQQSYDLAQWKVEGFHKLLPGEILLRGMPTVRLALEAFIDGRQG